MSDDEMYIKSNNTYNTGGGCMMKELVIENGGELKSITITAEAIVGNNIVWYDSETELDHFDNVLWIVTDVESLSCIPTVLQTIVVKEYDSFCAKHHDEPTITKGAK
jgi:hypothetical protein